MTFIYVKFWKRMQTADGFCLLPFFFLLSYTDVNVLKVDKKNLYVHLHAFCWVSLFH